MELGNPYTLLKKNRGMKVARPKMVQTGEDVSKSECLSVMDRIEASALT
jgi:hypothetical protein